MKHLRDEKTGACIFCGELCAFVDEPCDCAGYKAHIAEQERVTGGLQKLEEACHPNAQGWREPVGTEEYEELLQLLGLVARDTLHGVTAKLKNGTKITIKNEGGKITVERKEGGKNISLRG